MSIGVKLADIITSPFKAGILTAPMIWQMQSEGKLSIDPWEINNLTSDSYNLHLHHHMKRLTNDLDMRSDDTYEDLFILEDGLFLEPTECYLASTIEVIGTRYFPADVSGVTGVARKFLSIAQSSHDVHMGFTGQLTLEITVQRRLKVYPGMRIAQIRFFTPVGDIVVMPSSYVGQMGPTLSKGIE